MESLNDKGLPLGWSVWGTPSKMELAPHVASAKQACGGDGDGRFLRVFSGARGFNLACEAPVPVERGRAYTIAFWARGKGDISAAAHGLGASRRRLRVGDPQRVAYSVDTNEWVRFEQTWFAESLHVKTTRVFLGIFAREQLDIDCVSFQGFGEP